MFKLEILRSDKSHYWTEFFQSLEALDNWLKEEKTRPYWKEDFETSVTDISPPPRKSDEIESEKEKMEEKKERKTIAKELAKKKDALSMEESDKLLKLLAVEILGE